MKLIVVISSLLLTAMLATAPADAKGCLKGAVAGGAVGHYAGHHGLIGAAAGCLIGRHEAAQREREHEKARQRGGPDDQSVGPAYR
jgi:phage tail tape-measure protein